MSIEVDSKIDLIPNLFARARMTPRVALALAAHASITITSYTIALGLRFDFDPIEMLLPERCLVTPILLLGLRLCAVFFGGLSRQTLRHTSARDLFTVATRYALSTLALAAIGLLLRIPNLPRTVLVMELCLSVLSYGALGMAVRMVWDRMRWSGGAATDSRREVLILGAGDSGHLVAKNLLSQSRLSYWPRAILDDNERMRGITVHGVPVIGALAALDEALASFPLVSAVIVAIPSLSETRMRTLREVCEQRAVLIKRVQSFEDIACHDLEASPLLPIENMLEKSMHFDLEPEIRNALDRKRVLVTGAGGSIGSELVRQLLSFSLESLILLDASEFNLFQLRQTVRELGTSTIVRTVLANVRDIERLGDLFQETRPEIVFHAAAYKHVPILEDQPREAFTNNVVGTRNVLTLCHVHEVDRFILISTDKAVEPSSVMGCTKRIAELLVQEYCRRSDLGERRVAAAIVRFGNVINSTGSVIPLFKEQILRGGPLTITHPDVERFFMSLREAVQLVLVAGTLGEGGAVYVLDMGEPVKIVEVARKMLALYGRREIPITFVGLRPGEKMSERLTWGEEMISGTRFSKISRAEPGAQHVSSSPIRLQIEDLEKRYRGLSEPEISDALFGMCGVRGEIRKSI